MTVGDAAAVEGREVVWIELDRLVVAAPCGVAQQFSLGTQARFRSRQIFLIRQVLTVVEAVPTTMKIIATAHPAVTIGFALPHAEIPCMRSHEPR